MKSRPIVIIKTPSGRYVEPLIEETVDGFAPKFVLTEPGAHQIQITYQGKLIEGSPFNVTATTKPLKIKTQAAAEPYQAQAPMAQAARSPMMSPPVQAKPLTPLTPQPARVKVYGDGLVKALTDRPAEFVVDMRESGAAPLGIRIEGPVEAQIDCIDNENGTCACRYVAREPGQYYVHVLYNELPVQGSPFPVQVFVAGREHLDVNRIRVYGPGVQPAGKNLLGSG